MSADATRISDWESLAVDITLTSSLLYGISIPLPATTIVLAHLKTRRHRRENQRKHVWERFGITIPISEETLDLLPRHHIWRVRERAGLAAALERLQYRENLLVLLRETAYQRGCIVVAALPKDRERVCRTRDGVHVLRSWHIVSQGCTSGLKLDLQVCKLEEVVSNSKWSIPAYILTHVCDDVRKTRSSKV